ncbi:hypothetical protein [Neptunicella marina]|uniref:Lipoprotein n=1 Tax=Neptunicella marina TaxID=2125989 RepID=A0A8J6ISY2_9ALTE|nr:hypothetical protein [Neptunicella marina]MBC3766171.1 hypothetical protein [Neptunicella marina]
MALLKSLFVILSILTVSACSSIPLRTLYHMSQIDPLDVNARDVRIAVRADQAIRVQQGNVQFKLYFAAKDGSLYIDDTYLVQVMPQTVPDSDLKDGAKSGEVITLLSLSENDAMQMQRSQQLIAQALDKDSKGEGRITVDITGACIVGKQVPANHVVDLFLLIDPDVGYLSLIEDLDLNSDIAGESNNLNQWTQCAD